MKRTIAVASALLCLAVAAGPAWADGEDDPTFGDRGTSWVGLGEDTSPLFDERRGNGLPPRSDQAPDGSIITAMPIELDDESTNSRGGGDVVIRVTRMDGAGKLSGLDGDGIVDVDVEQLNDMLDVKVLADGRIVVVADAYVGHLEGRSSSRVLAIHTLDASGAENDPPQEFLPPDGCENANAEPAAADVAADGRVFVAWDCKGGVIVTRYIGDQEIAEELDYSQATALVFVDGHVYLLAETGMSQERLNLAASVVGKLDGDLVFDDAYGSDGFGSLLPGYPIDLTVGPGSEVTAWTTDGPPTQGAQDPLRGSGEQPPETWHFYNLDMAGEPDESWDEDGHAAIQHEDIGPLSICRRRGGGVGCESELPQLAAQPDGKIVAVGYPPLEDGEQTPYRGFDDGVDREYRDRTIIRLTTAGKLDPTWDDDGVRSFPLAQPDEGMALYLALGPPVFQSDGKLLIPSGAVAGVLNRVPEPPTGMALGVSRIGLTPPAPPPATPGAAGQTAAAGSTAAVVAASRSCVSRRVFRVRLRTGRSRAERSAIRSARVTVNGKSVPVTAAQRRTAQVNLTGLPRGRFTVVISLTLADGGKVRDVRRYRTCAPKQERELPGLRTRKPRR